jgi:hypothetical protein
MHIESIIFSNTVISKEKNTGNWNLIPVDVIFRFQSYLNITNVLTN